ncbi:MAG: DUF58 domain-containing protein [Planctomycetes bacterium]|nr:DUF58 domain-containing protein [Planctomycetota bacterium]
MPPSARRPPLPCPTVRLDAGLRTRAQRFAARLSAARGRREGAARAGLSTGGVEFDHYRPYRPGDDLRALDWDVYARSDQPVVRVVRPEAGERWTILVDTSASMGVGPPGKLQRAAECALALAFSGLREEAELELVDLCTRERFRCARRAHAAALAGWLEARVARGTLNVAGLRTELAAARGSQRGFLLSDLGDTAEALDGALPRGVRWTWIGILAPLEIEPGELGAVRWLDAESGEELALEVDREALGAYARALEESRERLARATAPRGIALVRGSSALEFEHLLARALRA